MQSHPGRFLGQHASDADSNGRRRMEAGRTIMLPNAMMQMPIQMWASYNGRNTKPKSGV